MSLFFLARPSNEDILSATTLPLVRLFPSLLTFPLRSNHIFLYSCLIRRSCLGHVLVSQARIIPSVRPSSDLLHPICVLWLSERSLASRTIVQATSSRRRREEIFLNIDFFFFFFDLVRKTFSQRTCSMEEIDQHPPSPSLSSNMFI